MSEEAKNGDNEMLKYFKTVRDTKYNDEEKKMIFNLVVNIMFSGNQIDEILKFNKPANYEILIPEYAKKLKLNLNDEFFNLIFTKVEKIHEKLHVNIETKKEKDAEDVSKEEERRKEEEERRRKEEKYANQIAEEKNSNNNVTAFKTKNNVTDLNFSALDVDGGSFPPPTSKKYKLVKK